MNFKDFKARRVSSYDRTGGNRDCISIPARSTAVLANIKGIGVIRHIWFTISCEDKFYLRKLILRMYWDKEKNPSVEVPVGDFFGVGHSKVSAYQSLPLNMTTNEEEKRNRSAMNCYFPMPFSRNARIEIINGCEVAVGSFYYYIDYEEHQKVQNAAKFHAQWRRENPCKAVKFDKRIPEVKQSNLTGKENYIILEAEGKGHYVGCNLSIHNLSTSWWGEGDDMIFVDGEKWPPSLHGTGTEDYFCNAWGMQKRAYLFAGTSLFNKKHKHWEGKWTVYRFHIEEPIPFKRSIKVTIEHGHANNRADDYSSVAYWYQKEPHKKFPKILPVKERLPRKD